MWKTLAAGHEFFAAVKNCTASGGFYWVFANITPDYDAAGKLQGYFSVRRHLRAEARTAIEPIYARMRAIEQEAGKQAGPDRSMEWLAGELAKLGVSYERFVLDLAGFGLEGGK
jgi:aerotaxis receptor